MPTLTLLNIVQTGAGTPTHTAAEGTIYWDTTNNKLYVNNDGATAWTEVGGDSDPTPIMITPASRNCLGIEMAAYAFAAPASAVHPVANLAIFVPFVLAESITVVKLFNMNGSTAVNNIDVGIYDSSGTRLVSSGSTVQSGINVIQEFDVTDTVMGPGLFYLAKASNDQATSFRWVHPSATAPTEFLQTLGMAQMATAFPLPATATLAAIAQNYVPLIGLSRRTLVT